MPNLLRSFVKVSLLLTVSIAFYSMAYADQSPRQTWQRENSFDSVLKHVLRP